MNIRDYVANELLEESGIYFLAGHEKFAYSEGPETEAYLLELFERAKDLSVNSRELESGIRDWPSRYHLSRERSLAYQALNIPPAARVLEIGSGCGAVTRLLGERAAEVLALEGSPRRAAITRARARGLDAVQVLCASFEDVVFREKFDVVVCNGVLEYASLFVSDEDPHRRLLKLLSDVVCQGGSLIVAIENKLGLRYFGSGKEEHTDIMFDGVEGYARVPGGARTFGASELIGMLRDQFPSVEMLLPLPDYKLPTAIIRKRLLDRVNCAELFANTMRYDFGSHVTPRMHERLVWRELQRNGLLADFANSFFAIASVEPTRLIEPDWMGSIYSIQRKPCYTVKTDIRVGDDDRVYSAKTCHEFQLEPEVVASFEHRTGTSPWVDGISVHTMIVRSLYRQERVRLTHRLREPVQAWWQAVLVQSARCSGLSGEVLDFNWANALVSGDRVQPVDLEWAWKGQVDPQWLVYRTVAKFMDEEAVFVRRWSFPCQWLTVYRMMSAIGSITGVGVNILGLIRAAKLERQFQRMVTGRPVSWVKGVALTFEPMILRHRRQQVGQLLEVAIRKVLRIVPYIRKIIGNAS